MNEELKNADILSVLSTKGKSYAKRKVRDDRPEHDYYPTPLPLIIEMEKLGLIKKTDSILEPACGKDRRIANYLEKLGYKVIAKDLIFGDNFFHSDDAEKFNVIVTNPPFSMWDDFVEKAKRKADKVIMIGRTNYFGAYQRYENGIWNGLKAVYIFNRQVAYDRFSDNEMKLLCGCLVTGWFVWEKNYSEKPEINIIDVQKYCK